MLQILFAIILFESECTLYLHRQECPVFLPLVFVLRTLSGNQQGRAAATRIPFMARLQREKQVWSAEAQGLQSCWEAWIMEDEAQ